MDRLVREVISRYLGDSDELPPDQGQDWMEYVVRKTTPVGDTEVVEDMVKKVKNLGEGFNITNPYDYRSPSDKPKDQKDSPPFESIIPPEIDYGVFMKPDMYGEEGDLKRWWRSRRRDWTDDPDQQQPAISIVRKKANADAVIAQYLLDNCPIITSLGALETEAHGQEKLAISLREIVNSDYHYKNDKKMQRYKTCNVRWQNKNNENQTNSGLFSFRVDCPDSKAGHGHTVFMQFLRPPEDIGTSKGYASYDVQLACTCLSFLYYGAQFYALKDNYMYQPMIRPDRVAPRHQKQYTMHASPHYPEGRRYPGRGLNFKVCKHVLAVYDKFVQRAHIEVGWERYPVQGPPSKIMNEDVWKKLIGWEFNYDNLRKAILSRKVPGCFDRENITADLVEWFNQYWVPRNDDQKIKAIQTLYMYPERVLFLLLKESYLKKESGERVSERLIRAAYDVMNRTIQEGNKQTPQQINEDNKEVSERINKGMGISEPGGEIPAEKFIKKPTLPSQVPQAITPVEQPLKGKRIPKDVRQRLTKRKVKDIADRVIEEQTGPPGQPPPPEEKNERF